MSEYQEMQHTLQVLCSRYEALTRALTNASLSPSYSQWLKVRRQNVANQIWEVKQWLFTHSMNSWNSTA